MNDELFENIVKKQLEIEERVNEELKKFKKNNSERKLQLIESVYAKVHAEKVNLDENNNYLVTNKNSFAKKDYFAKNFYGRIESVFIEFFDLIKSWRTELKYINLRDKQSELEEGLLKLSSDFDNLKNEDKLKAKNDFLANVIRLEENFNKHHQELEPLRAGREGRSYFVKDSQESFKGQAEKLKAALRKIICEDDDGSSSGEVKTPKNSEMGDEDRALTMEKAIAELVKLNVSKTKNNIQSLCLKYIVKFDSKNVRSFMNSVSDCLEECDDDDDVKKVLRFAKNRVTGNPIVAATEFATFEEFEDLMNAQFKPLKNHLQVNQEISFLMQKENENVTQFGARAVLSKVEYIEALYASYKAEKEELPLTRIKEAEALVVKHFLLGLKNETKVNIRSEPKSLTEAIGLAEAAATAAGLAEVSKTFADHQKSASAKHFNSRGGFRGASRGGRGGANGRQWNGGSGFSGHNSASGGKAQPQNVNASNESKGCWACGDEGHRKFECPNKASVSKAGRGGFSNQSKNQKSASSAQVSALAMQGQSLPDCE